MRTTEKKIQRKFEKIQSDLREEYHVEIFAPMGSHVNETKNIRKKIQKSSFFKNSKMSGHFLLT